MGFLLENSCTETLLLLTTLLVLVVNYFHNAYKYWEKRGVPTIKPTFPLGNGDTLLPEGFGVGMLSRKFYNELKSRGEKFGGIYLVTQPNLVLVDPEYVKDILAKDFQFFVDRGFYYNEKTDPLSAHLFALDGTPWRNLRIKLTPTFTSGKMKMMFKTVINCCGYMTEAINGNLNTDLDIKELLCKYTTDVIGSCAFGIECNSFKYPDAEFRQMGKRIFSFGLWRSIFSFCIIYFPNLSYRLGVPTNEKDVQEFFLGIVAESVKMRKEKNFKSNDFLQLLIDLKDTSSLSINEMAAQVFLFFAAGFESSSTTMTFVLYELARHPEVQEKLRQEIRKSLERHDGQLTYEGLAEMKYLQQVVDETLRLYPPLASLTRRCIKNYTLRDTNIVIEKGTPVIIPSLGIHMDPEYYPEPENFNPDNFNEENKAKRPNFVHLPFGDGPRNCIGLRFALMQSKSGIATVINNFKLTLSPSTKPLKFNPHSFILNTFDKIYLKAEKL